VPTHRDRAKGPAWRVGLPFSVVSQRDNFRIRARGAHKADFADETGYRHTRDSNRHKRTIRLTHGNLLFTRFDARGGERAVDRDGGRRKLRGLQKKHDQDSQRGTGPTPTTQSAHRAPRLNPRIPCLFLLRDVESERTHRIPPLAVV
jgi:hypothetical protein